MPFRSDHGQTREEFHEDLWLANLEIAFGMYLTSPKQSLAVACKWPQAPLLQVMLYLNLYFHECWGNARGCAGFCINWLNPSTETDSSLSSTPLTSRFGLQSL